MNQEPSHTPGEFRLRPLQSGNLRLYSKLTGETIAYILSQEWGDYENAPDGVTALKNAHLFRCAPALLKMLEELLPILERVVDTLHYENDEPVTALEPHEIEMVFADSLGVLAPIKTLIRDACGRS